jgi:hypothetical protein
MSALGQKADICAATSHVRFTPNSDRESEFPHKVMSALPPKADMAMALRMSAFDPGICFASPNVRLQLRADSDQL